jgi:hypothetical protein
MSDQRDARPGSEPAPVPPPPAAAGDDDEELFRYLLRNEDRFTDDALRQAAADAGHAPASIAAARARVAATHEGKVPANRYATWARAVVVATYLGTFALFAWGSDLVEATYGVGAMILGVVLLVTGLISLSVIGRPKVVAQDPLAALAGLLAVPFVLLVIVAGLCVVTTNPVFLPGPS